MPKSFDQQQYKNDSGIRKRSILIILLVEGVILIVRDDKKNPGARLDILLLMRGISYYDQPEVMGRLLGFEEKQK